MKLLLIAVSLCFVSGLWAADSATSVVSSVEDLTAKGVTFHRMQLQTPGASVEIETVVAAGLAVGEYQFTECVVLKDVLSGDRLAAADSAPDGADLVARRSKSVNARSVFLIRGNEIPKAYFAFEFSVPGSGSGAAIVRRYLLPVSAVKKGRVNPNPEPETAARAEAVPIEVLTHPGR